MRLKYILLLVLVAILSCSRSANPGIQSPNNSDLLINKKGKISAISGKLSNGTIIQDDYTNLLSYKKDDYWYFKSNLTFTLGKNGKLFKGRLGLCKATQSLRVYILTNTGWHSN